MEILPRNVLANMKLRAIAMGLEQIAPQLAAELKIPQDTLEEGLLEFAVLSSRVQFAPNEVDFETATAMDDPSDMARKAVMYFGSECHPTIDEAFKKLGSHQPKPKPKHKRSTK